MGGGTGVLVGGAGRCVGRGVLVGAGVLVGFTVLVAVGGGVLVMVGVAENLGVGVRLGIGVNVGRGVRVGVGTGVGVAAAPQAVMTMAMRSKLARITTICGRLKLVVSSTDVMRANRMCGTLSVDHYSRYEMPGASGTL